MTREEAVEQLVELRYACDDFPEDVEALQIAIETLKQVIALEELIGSGIRRSLWKDQQDITK